MAYIHFTSTDIARTSVLTAPLGSAEALLAMDMYERPGRGGPAFATWYRQVRQRSRVGALPTLSWPRRPLADMYRLLFRPRLTEEVARRRGGEDDEIRRVVQEFSAVALAPYWQRIAERLSTDREARARIVLSGGVDELLATLHPSIKWTAPVLQLGCGDTTNVHLNGRGLRLAPSLFLHGRPGVLIESDDGVEPPVLVYPALGDPNTIETLWQFSDPRPRALGALIGHTRAAALRELTADRTTGELGRRLSVSCAAASQHAAVLRKAGLITTRRRRNTAVHSLTPLGIALLNVTGETEQPAELILAGIPTADVRTAQQQEPGRHAAGVA